VCLGQRERVMDNSFVHTLLLLISKEIMSWLIAATIASRFSTLKVTSSGSLGDLEQEMVR